MKYINLFATTAMSVALAAGAASAQGLEGLGSTSFSAGVSLLSPEVTGFMYGGTTEVTGLGSAAVVIAAEAAQFNMSGFADSVVAPDVTLQAIANSGSITTFDFDRTVTSSASSIGAGQVLARGEASASVGAVGTSSAETMSSMIFQGSDPDDTFATTSDAVSTSAASLVGNGSTSVVAGLLGTTDEFIGSTGTTVSSTQSGVAFSGLNASGAMFGAGMSIGAAGVPGEVIGTSTDTYGSLTEQLGDLDSGQGIIGFSNDFTLDDGTIDLAVTNLGGGTISLGASTGGFFGGGAETFGESGSGSIGAFAQ
jgi:hypothetical protein